MKNVILMSRTEAATWKASGYRLGKPEYGQAQTIEAAPGATWRRVDAFEDHEPGPHLAFLKLRDLRLHEDKSKRGLFDTALRVFAGNYGLLGLFNETFGTPTPPPGADPFSWVVPDTVLDRRWRLREVDPATEGKRLLEAHLEEERLDNVILPRELRFPPRKVLTAGGALDPVTGVSSSETGTWEEVRDLYGVRAVLDERSASGVSFLSTREPLTFWDLEINGLKDFPHKTMTADQFDSRMRGVSPRAVADESGKLRHGWRCPSLLSAMYMMLFVDQTEDVEIRKCAAEDCPEWFRVLPGTERRKKRMYCPHPDDPRKRSRCAGRIESGKSRKRKRGQS